MLDALPEQAPTLADIADRPRPVALLPGSRRLKLLGALALAAAVALFGLSLGLLLGRIGGGFLVYDFTSGSVLVLDAGGGSSGSIALDGHVTALSALVAERRSFVSPLLRGANVLAERSKAPFPARRAKKNPTNNMTGDIT